MSVSSPFITRFFQLTGQLIGVGRLGCTGAACASSVPSGPTSGSPNSRVGRTPKSTFFSRTRCRLGSSLRPTSIHLLMAIKQRQKPRTMRSKMLRLREVKRVSPLKRHRQSAVANPAESRRLLRCNGIVKEMYISRSRTHWAVAVGSR